MSVKNLVTGDVFAVRGGMTSDSSCVINHHLGLLYIHIDNKMWEIVDG
jgi:hypothetical protein